MNQIINMIMRTVMRQLVSKGVNAGMSKASTMRMGRKKTPPQPQGEIDDFGNPVKRGPTREEVRAARRARRNPNTD